VSGERPTGPRAGPLRKRLGELLVEAGVIDAMQLQAVLSHQRKWGGRVGQCLVSLGFATEEQVVLALASKLGCPVADLSALRPGPELQAALELVPADLAVRHHLLPVAIDATTLTVAMADPTNIVVADELSFRVSRRVRILIAGETAIGRAVRLLYYGEEPPPPPGAPAPASQQPSAPAAPSPRQAALLEALETVANGGTSELFDSSRLAAALARAVLKKGIIADVELLAELAQRP
jgi:type IV pilus assembly protein PilB